MTLSASFVYFQTAAEEGRGGNNAVVGPVDLLVLNHVGSITCWFVLSGCCFSRANDKGNRRKTMDVGSYYEEITNITRGPLCYVYDLPWHFAQQGTTPC